MSFNALKTLFTTAVINTVVVLCLVLSGIAQTSAMQGEPYQSLSHQSRLPADNVLLPMMHSQNRQSEFRSRSEVMAEVKRRYDARVLRISLNKKREIYNVRLLMPSGKVRNIEMSARR